MNAANEGVYRKIELVMDGAISDAYSVVEKLKSRMTTSQQGEGGENKRPAKPPTTSEVLFGARKYRQRCRFRKKAGERGLE